MDLLPEARAGEDSAPDPMTGCGIAASQHPKLAALRAELTVDAMAPLHDQQSASRSPPKWRARSALVPPSSFLPWTTLRHRIGRLAYLCPADVIIPTLLHRVSQLLFSYRDAIAPSPFLCTRRGHWRSASLSAVYRKTRKNRIRKTLEMPMSSARTRARVVRGTPRSLGAMRAVRFRIQQEVSFRSPIRVATSTTVMVARATAFGMRSKETQASLRQPDRPGRPRIQLGTV